MMGRGLYRLCLLGFRDHAAPGKLLQIRVSQMRFPEFLGINKNIELLYTACRQAFAFAWTPFSSMGRSLNQRRRIYSKPVRLPKRIQDGVGTSVQQSHYRKNITESNIEAEKPYTLGIHL